MVTDVLTAIEKMAADGADIWEAAVTAAADAEQDMAARRWCLGDLAGLVAKQYGKNRLGDFAKAINVPVPTVKQYRRMAAFYPKDTRYLFENVGYSHYRAALRLKELDAALELLAVCAAEDKTVEAAQIAVAEAVGQPAAAVKLLDAEAVIEQVDGCSGLLVLYVGRGADLSALVCGAHVQLKVYEMEAA